MVANKNLIKNKQYIYYYNNNVKPTVITYKGMDTSREKFTKNVAVFEIFKGKDFYPRLSNVYDVKSLSEERKRLLVKLSFEAKLKH